MIKLKYHHFVITIVIIDSGQDHQWMWKPLGQSLLRNRKDSYILKTITSVGDIYFLKSLLITDVNSNFTAEKYVRHLNQMIKLPVSVSYCCCEKLPQTWRLKTTNLVSHSSLVQKPDTHLTRLKSRCWQGWFLCGNYRRDCFPCIFQLLETTYSPWLTVPFILRARG